MSLLRIACFGLALALVACKAKREDIETPARGVPAGIATSPTVKPTIPQPLRPRPQCAFVAAADVEAVVGAPITEAPVDDGRPDICGVFKRGDQELVAIGRRDGAFAELVASRRGTDVAGLGDAAVAFAPAGASPRLVVRKGGAAVYFLGTGMTDAQVNALAQRVVARL